MTIARPWIGRALALLFGLLVVVPAGCDLLGTGDRTTRPEGALLPLAVGNQWVFSADDTAARETTRVLDTTALRGRTYHVTNGVILPETLRTDGRGRVYRVQAGTEGLWVDPTVGDGGTYGIDTVRFDDEVNVRRVKVTRRVRVETPAGTFGNGIRYRFNYRGVADDTVWITFVPGVGPVPGKTPGWGPRGWRPSTCSRRDAVPPATPPPAARRGAGGRRGRGC